MEHSHEHGCGCGCGGHDHDHHHHHEHQHGEACGCGCGHDHGHEHAHIEIKPVENMTIIQQNMLLALYERRYLPVAQFVMAKAGEPDVQMTALAPVYMGSKEDTMDEVKAMGAQLQELEDAGLLSLDYDIGLEGYPYTEYTESDLFAYFQQTVKEAQDRPDLFVFDTAKLELGSMELTIEGVLAVRAMLPEE